MWSTELCMGTEDKFEIGLLNVNTLSAVYLQSKEYWCFDCRGSCDRAKKVSDISISKYLHMFYKRAIYILNTHGTKSVGLLSKLIYISSRCSLWDATTVVFAVWQNNSTFFPSSYISINCLVKGINKLFTKSIMTLFPKKIA